MSWRNSKQAGRALVLKRAGRTCRQRAMSAINKEGMLVVFASPLENVPYTLAEVAVAGIPLLTFDVGGATELIDPKTHEDLFCGLATVSCPHSTPLLLHLIHVLRCQDQRLRRSQVACILPASAQSMGSLINFRTHQPL